MNIKEQVYTLREQGYKYKEIGEKLGISACRSQQIYKEIKYKKELEKYELYKYFRGNTRTFNKLRRAGIKTKHDLVEAVNNKSIRNIGLSQYSSLIINAIYNDAVKNM